MTIKKTKIHTPTDINLKATIIKGIKDALRGAKKVNTPDAPPMSGKSSPKAVKIHTAPMLRGRPRKKTATPRASKTYTTTPPEIAKMKVLSDAGYCNSAIATVIDRDHNTVKKYLNADVYERDDIKALVAKIKAAETDDLYLLGAKARKRLHDLLDGGKSRMIETTAVMDRSFQQRQLLEGMPTQRVNVQTIKSSLDELAELDKKKQELLKLKAELEAKTVNVQSKTQT